ncbi:Uncharacterized protein FKW44_005221, partial [Caligus rogercresseyi]
TFIYLFAPICSNVRESDFMQNFRLEGGKRIWKALWEFNQPDVDTQHFIPTFSLLHSFLFTLFLGQAAQTLFAGFKETRSKNKGNNQQGMFKEDE